MSKYINKRINYALSEFEKGTPAHVKAAITYNCLLKNSKISKKDQTKMAKDLTKYSVAGIANELGKARRF